MIYGDAYADTATGILESRWTETGTYRIQCEYSCASDWPVFKEPPKKRQRIPFYRPLFDQRWPQSIRPTCKPSSAVRWQPRMGRVRINRTPA